MKVKSAIRRSVIGGSFAYGVVESYSLGLATVRLAKGGARLTNIPVTSYMWAGLEVIVDYTSDVPSVRSAGLFAYGRSSKSWYVIYTPPQSSNIASTRIPEP